MPEPGATASHQRPRIVRWVYLGLGCLFVGLGAVGTLLPLLPTTPFLLLAAACYARSSDRFLRWLLEHRQFGPFIQAWREQRGLPAGSRAWIIVVVLVTFAASILFGVEGWLARVLLGIVGLCLIIFLLRLPTWRPGEPPQERRAPS